MKLKLCQIIFFITANIKHSKIFVEVLELLATNTPLRR